MSENKTEVRVGFVPAKDGSIKVVVFSAPTSPPLLGAKAVRLVVADLHSPPNTLPFLSRRGAKNAPVEDDTVPESGAEAPLDASTLKTDLAVEDATAADRAKAMFAAHTPSANSVFWSKLARSTDPPAAPNGVTTNAPVLKPVIEDAPALEPVIAGGAPLPSIKDFSEEPGPAGDADWTVSTKEFPEETEPAPAGDADWNVSTKEFPEETAAPAGIDEWTTPFPRHKGERKGEPNLVDCSKNTTPIGRIDPNSFALLGTDGIEVLGGVSSGKARGGSKPSITPVSGTTVTPNMPEAVTPNTPEVTTVTPNPPEVSVSGWFCWPNLLCFSTLIALVLSGAAAAYSSHGSRGLVATSSVMPNVTALDPMPEPNSGLLFASPDRHPTFAPRPTPPVPNPVDDPNWLVAASGFCSDLSLSPTDGGMDFKFEPELSVAFTDAPYLMSAAYPDEGLEVDGKEYTQADLLAAGTWMNKNIALLVPTGTCTDEPAGRQDEFGINVFVVTGNEECGDECVHFSGHVTATSENFVARKESHVLCQLFVESHVFRDQLPVVRRRLGTARWAAPRAKVAEVFSPVRHMTFAPHDGPPPPPDSWTDDGGDGVAPSWLIATAGMCSDLTVTSLPEDLASPTFNAGHYESRIAFKFHPETSVAFTVSDAHSATEITDGAVVEGQEKDDVDILSMDVWNLKNIALLEPTTSCDAPPAGKQDEYGISVFTVDEAEKCGEECVEYRGKISVRTSNFPTLARKRNARFPCQLYVDSCRNCLEGETCETSCSPAHGSNQPNCYSNCAWQGAPSPPPTGWKPPPPPQPPPPPLNLMQGTVDEDGHVVWKKIPGGGDVCSVKCPQGTVVYPPLGGAAPPFPIGSYNDYGAAKAMNPSAWASSPPKAEPWKTAGCYDDNWVGSFDFSGWSMCNEGYAMAGIYRSDGDNLNNLDYARCCPVSGAAAFEDKEDCMDKDVSGSFDSEGWGECDANYYLKGMYRSRSGKDRSGLFNIETLKCCQTQNGAGDFSALANCEDYDITGLFDQPTVWAVCPPADTKVMKGMWRSNFGGDNDDDSAMHYLEKLRCCDYVPSPRALRFGPHEYGYTPEECATKCRGYSPPYRFSAVQDGSWCSCDSDFTRVKMYGATSSYIEVVWATYGGNCGRASNNQLANLVATCSGLEKCYYNIGSGLDIGYEVGATIEVISATYGGNCDGANSNNQLGNLAKECNGKTSCSYDVNHETIGDPTIGCAKTYEYKWKCGATSFSKTAPSAQYSTETPQKNVQGHCSSAPGGNSDLGGCSSQADCEARCNSNAACLGYVDMTLWGWGYELKNYVGPNCLDTRGGFVLHIRPSVQEASGTTIKLDCPADPCANKDKAYEYMFKCSAGDTALWSSGTSPYCQEYGGTVWAMCNGKPYELHSYGPEGITQAIRNCNYAYTNPAGSHYGTLCPKLYTVAAEARGQNVALSCSEDVGGQPEINSCQPNGGAWCNAVYDTSTARGDPVVDDEGNWLCLAPQDGSACQNPDDSACRVSLTCGDHEPLQQLYSTSGGGVDPTTWSCLAYDPAKSAAEPFLTHGSLPDAESTNGAVPGWFPFRSPLGIMMKAEVGTSASEILQQRADGDLARQCAHPPFLFAYDIPQSTPPSTFASPGLGPPASHLCNAGAIELLTESDLLLAIGTEDVEFSYDSLAFDFNGASSYARFPRGRIGDGAFSIALSVWISPFEAAGCGTVGKWYHGCGLVDGEVSGATNDFGLSIGDGRVMFGVGGPSAGDDTDPTITSDTSIADGEWHTVLATRDGPEIALYVDGREVGRRNDVNAGPLTAATFIDVGRIQTGGNYFNGTMANLKIVTEVLPTVNSVLAGRMWIYDDTMHSYPESVLRWNEVCGQVFWSLYSPEFDWDTLKANVVGCKGSFCKDGRFDYDTYVPLLVYASQLRTQSVANGTGDTSLFSFPATELAYMAGLNTSDWYLFSSAETRTVANGLAASQTVGGRRRLSATDAAREKLLAAAESTVGGMAEELARMVFFASDSVPAYDYKFYYDALTKSYDAFVAISAKLKKSQAGEDWLKMFMLEVDAQQTKTVGAESVLETTQEYNLQSITAASSGMQSALKGIKKMGTLMNMLIDGGDIDGSGDCQKPPDSCTGMEKGLEKLLEEYMTKQKRLAWVSFFFTVADIGLGTVGNLFAASSEGAKTSNCKSSNCKHASSPWDKSGSGYDTEKKMVNNMEPEKFTNVKFTNAKGAETQRKATFHLMGSTQIFVAGGLNLYYAGDAIAHSRDICDGSEKLEVGSSCDEAGDAMKLSMEELLKTYEAPPPEGFGWNASVMRPWNETSITVLDDIASDLNVILPRMGEGFWAEFKANTSSAMEEFTTGYTGDIRELANRWLGYNEASMDYGSDYVAQGNKFVAAVQQAQVDYARQAAVQATQDALDLIDYEVDLLGTVMNDQQQTLSLQMTQLALEMTTTTRKLCQSFRYQTTRLYRECVGPNRALPDVANDMNDLCGGIGDAFVNLAMPPSEHNKNDADKVMEYINDYLTTYGDVYAQATAVTDKVNNRLWGGASVSAIDNTFVDVKLKPWAPPPCDGTNGYVEETSQLCNENLVPSSSYSSSPMEQVDTVFPASWGPATGPVWIAYEGNSCMSANESYPEGFPVPEGEICCNQTSWFANCAENQPPREEGVVWVTEANFSLFTNKLRYDGNINPAWGRLKFTISPEGTAFANLDQYDELFVQGMTFFMPGARMTNENNVQANLIPTGAMSHRIKKREMGDLCGPDQTPCCQGDDPHNLCTFENFTFSAGSATQDKAEGSNAPTEPQTVNYMSYYRNTVNDGATARCDDTEYNRNIVFSEKHRYKDPPFEDCTDVTAYEKCQNYCTSLDFDSLDNSNPAQYSGRGSKYNYASLFAGFELSVKSQAEGGRAGVHLEGVSEIWLGLWLGPAGEKNSNLPSNECSFR